MGARIGGDAHAVADRFPTIKRRGKTTLDLGLKNSLCSGAPRDGQSECTGHGSAEIRIFAALAAFLCETECDWVAGRSR